MKKKKIYKKTKEHRKRLSESLKGKKLSKQTKLKIKLANIGKHHSEKTKQKLSKFFKGRKLSEETKKKIGRANEGKKRSEEVKKQISERQMGDKNHTKRLEVRKKLSNALKGKNNPNWKNGITPENMKIRESIEYRLWREAVFARDNFTCQKCKRKGGKLNSHHIENFSDYPELRFAIDNGITFCKKCHKKFHKKYGIRNNIREQIKEFLTEDEKRQNNNRNNS